MDRLVSTYYNVEWRREAEELQIQVINTKNLALAQRESCHINQHGESAIDGQESGMTGGGGRAQPANTREDEESIKMEMS